MTNSTATPLSLAARLRGTPATRPARDIVTAPGLRAQLDDVVASRGLHPRAPLILRSRTLRSNTVALESSPMARLRGLLVTTALTLLVHEQPLEDAFEDTMGAWCSNQADVSLLSAFAAADADVQARLRADVRSHVSVLRDHLGTFASSWRPQTAVRTQVLLSGGALVLRDDIDLMVGSVTDPHAALTLLDITTAPLGERAEHTLRYHALVQTLRSGVVPLRVAMFSTATADCLVREVDPALLQRAVDDLATHLSTVAVAA